MNYLGKSSLEIVNYIDKILEAIFSYLEKEEKRWET